MKTINKILGFMILTLLLSSCFGGDTEGVKDAKEELGVIKAETIDTILDDAKVPENDTIVVPQEEKDDIEDVKKVEDNINTGSPVIEKDNPVVISKPKVEDTVDISTEEVTEEKFLKLNGVNASDLAADGIELSGETLGNVDKIMVHFKNEDSDFPNDSYQLKAFQPGDKTFLYRAFRKYETFDYGKNTYLFVAYSGDKTSEVELVIDYHKTEEVSQELEVKAEDTQVEKEVSVDAASIDGLTLSKEDTQITCENVTDVLSAKLNSWFYWNTCREINKTDGYSYYVVRLEGEKYFYEKHYSHIDGDYGVFLLETGEGVTSDDLAELNATLKEKNADYTGVDEADTYFNGL